MRFSSIGFMRRYMRNEDGVISVMAVGALVLAFAVAMIVIDTGAMYSAYRYQQSATDAAALGAVRQIGEAQNVAETIFNLNEYSTENITATPLYYVADPSLAPNGRFFFGGGDSKRRYACRRGKLQCRPRHETGTITNLFCAAVRFREQHASRDAGGCRLHKICFLFSWHTSRFARRRHCEPGAGRVAGYNNPIFRSSTTTPSSM